MKRKRHTPQEIIVKLREAEADLNQGASIRQDLAKSAGFVLGLHERYLPLAVKRRLSAFRLFE